MQDHSRSISQITVRLNGESVDSWRLEQEREQPVVRRIEHVSSARLTFLFGPVGDRMIGAVCTLLAFILMLPLLGGNLLPAATISVFAIALIQRDGLLALLGYVLAAISFGVLALAAGIIHRGIVSVVSGF